MKILALDSTGRVATVAVAENEKILASFSSDSGLTQSELLLPMVKEALAAAHVPLTDIGLFAATVGPGSFTGVRIGISLVKGLAFEKNTPCVPVSVMEAEAEALRPLAGIYCPVSDARRGQVYNALFCEENGTLRRLCDDRLLLADDLLAELQKTYPHEPILFVGDACDALIRLAKEKASSLTVSSLPPSLCLPSATAVAACGLRAFRAGRVLSPSALSPVYLRPTQAECELNEKNKPELPVK